MSKSPMNNSFNKAANPHKQDPVINNQVPLSNAKKNSVPKLQLNPPASPKTIKHQLTMDNAAALTRTQIINKKINKEIPSAKKEFAKAKISGKATHDFNSVAKNQKRGLSR